MESSILVYNPRAGRWRTSALVDALLSRLRRTGIAVEAQATHAPGHATRIARRCAQLGAPAVFAFGGDGTLRETAAGLLGSGTAFAPLPGGTTNVVVRALGLPTNPLAAAEILARSAARPLDVGMCGDEPFLMQASTGLDAVVMDRVSPLAKRVLGRIAVGARGLLEWLRYRYPDIDLVADGHPLQATLMAACNLPLYGGPFALAPDARPDDGRLDLVLFRGRGRLSALGFAAALARGTHLARPDVSMVTVDQVELAGTDVLMQLDGDAMRFAAPTIRLAKSKLQVLLP